MKLNRIYIKLLGIDMSDNVLNDCMFSRRIIKRNSNNGLVAKGLLEKYWDNSLIEGCDKDRVGIIYATCFGALNEEKEGILRFQTENHVSPLFLLNILSSMVSSNTSIDLKIKGLNYSISSGESSFLEAIIDAIDLINNNVLDTCIVIGSEHYFSSRDDEKNNRSSTSNTIGGGILILSKNNSNFESSYFLDNYQFFYETGSYNQRIKKNIYSSPKFKNLIESNGFIINDEVTFSPKEYSGCLQSIQVLKMLLSKLDSQKNKNSTGTIFIMLENGVNIFINLSKEVKKCVM